MRSCMAFFTPAKSTGMTDRLYYTDAYLPTFTARITAIEPETRRVYLDRSAFYPTSGGQPHDIGRLGEAPVIDVVDEDSRVAHVVESVDTLAVGVAIEGQVEWSRRFDFMQQHTGQHLLSALCADGYGWPTTSVHFGDDYCTVDIAAAQVGMDTVREIERRANAAITTNIEVLVSFEDASAATGLRKPSDRAGALRIVTIAGIDRSACGGTHVRRTGEIGSMLLRRVEKTKGATRIEFLCGARAVRRASADADLLTRASRTLSAAPDELPGLVETQLARISELERERKRLAGELARHDAQERWNAAPVDASGNRIVQVTLEGRPVRDAEPLAQALSALGRCVVLVRSDTPHGVMLASAADSGVDAGALLKPALVAFGGRGGGSPRLAQGSIPDADAVRGVIDTLQTAWVI